MSSLGLVMIVTTATDATTNATIVQAKRCCLKTDPPVVITLFYMIAPFSIKVNGPKDACILGFMALFTGKGDGGTTKVFGCDQQRISKSSELPEALGALDELNAFLGFTKMRCAEPRIKNILHETQETLFIVQAEVAGADKKVKDGTVAQVEHIVNGIEKEIPPLKGFSIAGGTELSALLDVARTLSRRAERRLV